MNPRVSKVVPIEKYKLLLTFTNNEKGIYDCSDLLDFGIFKELKEENYFNKVSVKHGTIFWPHGQDICPDTLYLEFLKQN